MYEHNVTQLARSIGVVQSTVKTVKAPTPRRMPQVRGERACPRPHGWQ